MADPVYMANIPDVPSTTPEMKQFLRALKQNVGVLSVNESILDLLANGGSISEDYRPVFNLIQNPSFTWAQRATTATMTTGLKNVKVSDRWTVDNETDGQFTASRETCTIPGIPYCFKLDPTTADASLAAGQYVALFQQVEGMRAANMFLRPAVLSFYVYGVGIQGKVFSVSVRNGAATKSFVSTFTVETEATWERKTIALPVLGTTDGTWAMDTGVGMTLCFTLACGSTFQTSVLNQWIGGNFLGWSGQDNLLSGTTGEMYFTGVQLEPGSTVHPVYTMPPAEELAALQRYYEKSYNVSTLPATVTNVGGVFDIGALDDPYFTVQFKVSKRVTPTAVTTYSTNSGASSYAYEYVTLADAAQSDIGLGENAFFVRFTTAAADHLIAFHWVAVADLP